MIGAGFALAVAADVLSRMISLIDSLLGDRFTHRLDVLIMQHASSLDLASFEDPLFYDKMERARQQARARLGMLVAFAGMARQTITLATMMVAVAAFSPWLLVLLAASTVPVFLGRRSSPFSIIPCCSARRPPSANSSTSATWVPACRARRK